MVVYMRIELSRPLSMYVGTTSKYVVKEICLCTCMPGSAVYLNVWGRALGLHFYLISIIIYVSCLHLYIHINRTYFKDEIRIVVYIWWKLDLYPCNPSLCIYKQQISEMNLTKLPLKKRRGKIHPIKWTGGNTNKLISFENGFRSSFKNQFEDIQCMLSHLI